MSRNQSVSGGIGAPPFKRLWTTRTSCEVLEESIGIDTSDARGLRPCIETTPESCAEVRRALDVALETFLHWNIDPPSGTWVQEAAQWLEYVTQRKSLGATDEELQRTSAAIAMVVDFYHISTSLGIEANRQVGAELARLANGRLPGPGRTAAGKDFLSQFWVGTLLAQSKLEPRIPAYDRPNQAKPDFLIERGRVSFAIEVKRPQTTHSARRAVLKAGDQLRTLYMPGIIVIDATDCLTVDPWAIHQPDSGVREQRASDIAELHNVLRSEIASYSRSSKLSEIGMLLTFARYWNWERRDDGAPVRDAGIVFHAYGFPYLWSAQVTKLTHEIQEALMMGVHQLTGNMPRFRFS
jgi:hypothetical protein